MHNKVTTVANISTQLKLNNLPLSSLILMIEAIITSTLDASCWTVEFMLRKLSLRCGLTQEEISVMASTPFASKQTKKTTENNNM